MSADNLQAAQRVAWGARRRLTRLRARARRWRPARRVASLLIATLAVGFVLSFIQALLVVPRGFGVEDYLGWVDPGAVTELASQWAARRLQLVAAIYLLVDGLAFVPLYTSLLMLLGVRLAVALTNEAGEVATQPGRVTAAAFAGLVLSLTVVDVVENAAGLGRLGGGWGWVLGACLAAASLVLVLLVMPPRVMAAVTRQALVGALLVAGLAGLWAACSLNQAAAHSTLELLVGAAAHEAKQCLSRLVVLALLGASACWFFGVRLGRQIQETSEQRARVRAGLIDIVVRSRYVLLALAIFGAVTLISDQARDALYAIVSAPYGHADKLWGISPLHLLGSFVVMFFTAIAMGLLVFACYLWARSVCQILSAASEQKQNAQVPEGVEVAAKYWARLLGALPLVMLLALTAKVIRDIATTQSEMGPSRVGPVLTALGFAVACLLMVGLFLANRSRQAPTGYYNALNWETWCDHIGLGGPTAERYLAWNFIKPYLLPMVIGAALIAGRLIDAVPTSAPSQEGYLPTLSLMTAALSIAFWLCFLGWLSMLEVRRATPWGLVLLVVAGALSLANVTDNHVVWPMLEPALAGTVEHVRLWMGIGSTALMLIVIAAYKLVMDRVHRSLPSADMPPARQMARVSVPVWKAMALALGVVGVLGLADRALPGNKIAQAKVVTPARPTLDQALARWLARICNAPSAGANCKDDPAQTTIPAYFTSTEGGGIRAAAWTAYALESIRQRNPQFEQQLFSVSGVSGGAVGAALWRACLLQSRQGGDEAVRKCLDDWTSTDHLSALLGPLLFEDLLAWVLPTSFCSTPGCGFVSRGAWMERSMEAKVAAMRLGLVASGARDKQHVPYLLLNSTWVETGERAIASDLDVSQGAHFPAAQDQLARHKGDLPLSSAAHNAARFPYISPVGALKSRDKSCEGLGGASGVCGHLADGGYFENGGTLTTFDILAGLQSCLQSPAPTPEQARTDDFPQCARTLSTDQRDWLRKHLAPQVLMIRSAVHAPQSCEPTGPVTAQDVVETRLPACNARSSTNQPLLASPYEPLKPLCAHRLSIFADLLAPPVALFSVSGIRGHARLADAQQMQMAKRLQGMLLDVESTTGKPKPRKPFVKVITLDLADDGALYPLGWHMSAAARGTMRERADLCGRDGLKG